MTPSFSMSPPSLVKLREVAKLLGVSIVTVRRRVREGSLPHLRMKGRLYFRPTEVHAFIEAHRGAIGY